MFAPDWQRLERGLSLFAIWRSSSGVESLRGWARRAIRRPDVWVAFLTLLVVLVVLARSSRPSYWSERLTQTHLAHSFGAAIVATAAGVFAELLLRCAPSRPRRALRITWLGVVVTLTSLLLQGYTPTALLQTNWALQALVLAVVAATLLLTVLLGAAGLVRWREVAATAYELARHWCTIFFYLLLASYLLGAVRVGRPEVIDPILLRMDLSLGFSAVEAIVGWTARRPLVEAATHLTYPLLGLFIAGVAASLHLAGAIAEMRRHLLSCLLIGLLGIGCYWFAPAVGPVFAFPKLFGSAALSMAPAELDALRQAIVDGPDSAVLRTDLLRNVMPSLHTAFSLVSLAAAWRHRRWLLWCCLPLGFTQIATTLTYGVHYAVDLIAAVPLAILCWWLAEIALRRVPPVDVEPLPGFALNGRSRRGWTLALALSLVLAAVVLVVWGRFAPLPPWLGWGFVLLVAAVPAGLASRLFAPRAQGPTMLPAQVSRAKLRVIYPARLLATAVFCSGGTALIVEQVAEKYLSTLLGASRPAATVVLVVYFTGLALGALLCPRGSGGAARRLAMLELFIAFWAALLALGFFATDGALGDWLARTGTHQVSLGVARTALAILWLLPPTLAMGAQLPTLASVLASHPELEGQSLPRLYALNLAGAFAFTVAAPPLLFNIVGADGALWFTAMLGVLVSVALWSGLPVVSDPGLATFSVKSDSVKSDARHPRAYLWAFAAGFGFLTLEVVWFHLISAVSGASTYSFSILLAVVLLGLALAGLQVARSAHHVLASTLGWLALALSVSSALWPWSGRIMAETAVWLDLESFWAGELLKFLGIGWVVLPPVFILGRIFPSLLGDRHTDTRHVARLSVANVLGCVAGALVTGFVLVPALGAERTLLGAVVAAAVGSIASWRRVNVGQLAPALAALGALVLLPSWNRMALTSGHGVYLRPTNLGSAELLSFAEDFHAGFVTVVATPTAEGGVTKTLLQNGKFDADDKGEVPAQVGFGLVAALHAPKLERALVLGAGSGQTASVIARLGFERIDVVELSPAHVAAAREHFSHLNRDLFNSTGVAVHIEDGRQHLLRTEERYDLIQVEVTSIWFAGATNLYSQEFYALARERLSQGGVLVQWVQLHHLTPREIATILATARAEFKRVSVWRVGGQACFLASQNHQVLNPQVISTWRTSPTLAAERRATRADSAADFVVQLLVSPSQLDLALSRYQASVGLNTDRNRWLEFQTPKYYLDQRDHRAQNLIWLNGLASSRR